MNKIKRITYFIIIAFLFFACSNGLQQGKYTISVGQFYPQKTFQADSYTLDSTGITFVFKNNVIRYPYVIIDKINIHKNKKRVL